VHALFASSSGDDGAGLEGASSRGYEPHSTDGVVRALTRRLDAELQERAALSERLEQMSAQMEALIDLGSYNAERSMGRRSASADRQSPSSAARAQRSFTPSREDHRGHDRRRSSSSLKLHRTRGEDSPPWHSDEDSDDSVDDNDSSRSGRNASRRRRAQ
jgi:hypothetical protein